MNASIIIRAFNEGEHIERLMLGIAAQAMQPEEVILVDSGSTDDTAAIARRHGANVLTIAREEFTFGRALNRGCQEASGDACVLVSAHAYPVQSTWLERLLAPLADDRVALSYGRQLGNSTNRFSEHQIFAQWFPPDSACPQPTDFCNNANCAIRRSVWESHRYHESLPGLEDLAWAKEARARGHWIAYVADAEVIHVHDEPWDQVQNRYRREAMALRSIDEHAHFTRADLATLLTRTIVSDARAATRQGALLSELPSILRFRFNQLVGAYRGFNGPPELSAELRSRFYYPGVNGSRMTSPAQDQHRIDYEALEAEQSLGRGRSQGGS